MLSSNSKRLWLASKRRWRKLLFKKPLENMRKMRDRRNSGYRKFKKKRFEGNNKKEKLHCLGSNKRLKNELSRQKNQRHLVKKLMHLRKTKV